MSAAADLPTPSCAPNSADVDSEIADRMAARASRRLTGRDHRSPDKGLGLAAVIPSSQLVGPQTPLPKRSTRAEPIRDKLLDVAELLFARWGYTGVSVRDVTDLAKMRLANVSYYFGSKQNLYFEVLRRRAEPLSIARMEMLDRLCARDIGPDAFLDGVIDAYMDPALDLAINGGPGWRNYFQLAGHMTYTKLWPDKLSEHYNVAALHFIAALQSRFPEASSFDLQSAVLMLVGPSTYTLARTGRIETFENPAFSSDDLDRLGPQTKLFMRGGLKALLLSKAG